jgi:pilus assembly protein TadC
MRSGPAALPAELFASLAAALATLAVGACSRGRPLSRLGGGTPTEGSQVRASSLSVIGPLERIGGTKLGSWVGGRTVRATAISSTSLKMTPESFTGMVLASGSAGLLIGLMLPWPGPLVSPLLMLIGVRFPFLLTARARKRRLDAIDAEVPQLLDLLAAASSAGLSTPVAFRRASEAITGPLRDEIEVVLRAVDLGGRWRDELRSAADRLELVDVRRAVAVITRAETLGSSLAESTAELAATVRQARRAALTERARTVPVKMLFPLVFLVLPAFLLLTVVPVLLTTLRSIS